MKDISTFNREKCNSEGHLWDRGKCKPLSLENVMKLDIDSFCKAAKGNLKTKGNSIILGDGIKISSNKICGFDAIHIANDRDRTEWAPNIPTMLDATGNWYIAQLMKQAVACQKNDRDEVIGDFDDIKKQVLDELTTEEKKQLKIGELDLDELVSQRIDSDMESNCQDIWSDIKHNEDKGLTGDWSGDNHNQYDLGETEWLFTNENANRVWQNEEDIDFEDTDAESTFPSINPHQHLRPIEQKLIGLQDEEIYFKGRFQNSAYALNDVLNIEKADSFIMIFPKTIDLLPTSQKSTFKISERRETVSEKNVYPKVNGHIRETPVKVTLSWIGHAEDKDLPAPIPRILKINEEPTNPKTDFTIGDGDFMMHHKDRILLIKDKKWQWLPSPKNNRLKLEKIMVVR